MSTKEKILKYLEENRGEYISGTVIAKELGISRNAVCKVIKELGNAGYEIEAIKNRGYCLTDNNDIISAQGIMPFLGVLASEVDLKIYDSLESSNYTAKQMAIGQRLHGTVVIAKNQSRGVGHNGMGFTSPDGGIYMSVILDPDKITIDKPSYISAWSVVTVCKAIEKLSDIKPEIDLVTDIFVDERKICGILTESAFDFETEKLQWLVIGIGIKERLTASRNEMIAEIIKGLMEEADSDGVREYYNAHHRGRLQG